MPNRAWSALVVDGVIKSTKDVRASEGMPACRCVASAADDVESKRWMRIDVRRCERLRRARSPRARETTDHRPNHSQWDRNETIRPSTCVSHLPIASGRSPVSSVWLLASVARLKLVGRRGASRHEAAAAAATSSCTRASSSDRTASAHTARSTRRGRVLRACVLLLARACVSR